MATPPNVLKKQSGSRAKRPALPVQLRAPSTAVAARQAAKKEAAAGETGNVTEPVRLSGGHPLHLQDKSGFCAAACMQMLLEDAFPGQPLPSQGELMRKVKKCRDEKKGPAPGEAESRYGWHASPREIQAVLNAEFTSRTEAPPRTEWWQLIRASTSKEALEAVHRAIAGGGAVMALIWHPGLRNKLPHWVVLEESPDYGGCRVLDPAVGGLPDRIQRFECFHHGTKVWTGGKEPLHFCPCRVWRDAQGQLHASDKIWIHCEKLEELLDEGAALAGGLRYIIARAKPASAIESLHAYETARRPRELEKSFADLVREMDLQTSAEIYSPVKSP
jgi:hypothetical protein